MPKQLDENKPIPASEYIKDPDSAFTWTNIYVIVRDMSMNSSYTNLILAINLLAERGWETMSIGGDASGYMHALVRNTHYKRKNELTERPSDTD